ncbi:MAG: hypothetical protein E7H69_18375, partial [Clostridioides difficile]|nr:hypothetical protein [Clostridioides difficile]
MQAIPTKPITNSMLIVDMIPSPAQLFKEPAQKAGFCFSATGLSIELRSIIRRTAVLFCKILGGNSLIRSYTQNNMLNPVKTTIQATFKNRPARIISCCLIWPVAKTIAFGGVATGSI